MSSALHLTDCGVPGIRDIPYGVHLCHFYDSAQDLVEALVPYFEAGLRNNERCLWVTADPLRAAQAKLAMRRAFPGVDAAIEQGRLRVLDFADWYTTVAGSLKGADLVNAWLDEERAALAAGYSGLRITGNTSFLTPDDWDGFMEYEHAVSRAFEGRRIVTLCSYALPAGDPVRALDVARSHHASLHRSDSSWQVLTAR